MKQAQERTCVHKRREHLAQGTKVTDLPQELSVQLLGILLRPEGH